MLKAIESVIDTGVLVMGPVVEEFESKLAELCNRRYSIGVSSGTDALFTGLRALELCPGDEIITTSISWIATANAIKMAGLKPVFADVNENLNIDVASVARLINSRTKAILTVNFNGLMSEVERLMELCNMHGLIFIEDAAQSFGAFSGSNPSGSFGFFTAMSHNPMKIFGGLGECGSILTNSEQFASRIRTLRYNGTVDRQTCTVPSLNSRLDALQASVLLSRIEYAYFEIECRRRNAAIYDSLLDGLVQIPTRLNRTNHVYYTYTIRTPRRDELQNFLFSRGIETKIMHPQPMPCHPAYSGSSGEWEKALLYSSEILSLPIASHIDEPGIREISNQIHAFFEKN